MPVYRRMERQNIYGGLLSQSPNQNSTSGSYAPLDRAVHEDYQSRRSGGYNDQRGLMLESNDIYSGGPYVRGHPPHNMGMSEPGTLDTFPSDFDPQHSYSIASSMQSGYHSGRGTSQYGYQNAYQGHSGYPSRGTAENEVALHPSAFDTGTLNANSPLAEPEEYLRTKLGLKPGDPINLWSLPDPEPGQRPPHPYPILIRLAIQGSNNKRLTLKGIYEAVEARFEYYKNDPKGAWKGSIRHNLSLNKCFRNVNRPLTEPGKGNYWEIDHSQGEGYKRDRKRKARKNKSGRDKDEDDEDDFSGDSSAALEFLDSDPQSQDSMVVGRASSSRVQASRQSRRSSPYSSPSGGTRCPITSSPRSQVFEDLANSTRFDDPQLLYGSFNTHDRGTAFPTSPRHGYSNLGSHRMQQLPGSPQDIGLLFDEAVSSPEGSADYASSGGYDDPSFLPDTSRSRATRS
ncbi:hypothetical protein FA15DRAFT_761043 [Coprinopsis marcescibilis]|uniref:Fork-head domain-containing protein n=1 Tax=Coprinopsis marcescibilis TaxID=230819 RepID=A0A5C3KC34_COPMA|nr:hypothetical protein FA15DRAFT_761043 [Coprinopsis marcescibilis]